MVFGMKNILIVGVLLFLVGGCNIAAVNLNTSTDVQKKLTPQVVDTFWDPEIMEYAITQSIVVSEFGMKVTPEYEPALVSIILNYAALGQYWLVDKMERAERAGNFEEVEKLNRRMGNLFDRANMYARILLRLRDDGFDRALAQGWDAVKEWVNDNFYREEDAEVLTVAGAAFILPMMASAEGGAAFTDRPLAEILLARSIELNPEYRNGLALSALGGIECSTPKGVGGNPEKGLAQMRQAVSITKRQSLGYLVIIAERCAVGLQDRKLFRSALNEVIEAGDHPKFRLWNKFARYKAERLLKQEDELFFEE
jgi:hypothetical protein